MKYINYILPVTTLIISFIFDIEVVTIFLAMYVIYLYFTDVRIIKRIKSKFLILFFIVLLFFYPLTGSKGEIALPLGFTYDLSLLYSSIKMCLRALLLMLFFNQLILNVESLNLKKIGNMIGFNNYDEILKISEELLPTVKNKISILIEEIKNGMINLKSPTNLIANFLANLLKTNDINNK